MKISIFTPTHDTKYLLEAYNSIKNQDFFEWIIVKNNGAIIHPEIKSDKRVKILSFEHTYVGALKKYACGQCSGDVFLELDHDDLLAPTAIEEVKKAFEDQEVGFVYSNFSNFRNDFEPAEKFSTAYGWEYRPFEYEGHQLDEYVSFAPTASSVSRIWYAPNHLRAWRREAYVASGGHPEDMRVLDDQDLMCRTYLVTKMAHIDKCLYLYRITGENTWLKYNAEIQEGTMRLYNKYIKDLAIRESELQGLLKLDFGGRFNGDKRCQSVDLKDADVVCDLNKKLPFKDNSVGVIIANDVLEHLKDPVHSMKEIHRVLAPGGYLIGQVPSTDGRGAWQDPTHVSFWNENSFLYYTHENWAKYIDTPVRFQSMNLYTTEKDANQVCWAIFNLRAIKDSTRMNGLINI